MARLPTPGGDNNDWGDILNSFLDIAHNDDGTLQPAALQQAGAITSVNSLSPTNGALTFSTNDLSDTAISTPTDNEVLAYSSGAGKWQNATFTSLGAASDSDIGTWVPADSGLLTANFPPLLIATSGSPINSTPNNVILIRLPVRSAMTISNICIGLEGPAGSATSTGTFVGVYDTAGALLGGSLDIASMLANSNNSQSLVQAPLAFSVTVQPPWIYAALLINMLDPQQPNFYCTAPPMDFFSLNFGLTVAEALFAYTPGTYDSLPVNLDLTQNIFGSPTNCAFFAAAT